MAQGLKPRPLRAHRGRWWNRKNTWRRSLVLCALLWGAMLAGACAPTPSPAPGDSRGVVYVTSSDGKVLALRANDGSVVWKAETKGDPHCQPILANGVLYVDEPDLLHDDGVIYAFDARTGAVRWKYAYQGITSSLLLADGILYAGSGTIVSRQGAVFAVRASDGIQVWKRSFAPYEPVLTAVHGGVVFGGTVDGIEVALRASDGAIVWQTTSRGIASAPPTLAGETLYVASDALLALNSGNGSIRWQLSRPEYIANYAPVVANGVVYVGSSGVYAVRAADGVLLWHTALGEGMNAPVVVGDTVYAGNGQRNTLTALAARDGSALWTHHTGYGVTLPTVVDGMIYIGSDTAAALRPQDGSSIWSHAVQPSVIAAPIARDGMVYVATAGNYDHHSHVLALRASDGALVWQYEVGPNLYYSPLLGPAV